MLNNINIQSEYRLDEWCVDCKEYDKEKCCCPRYNKVIRTTLQDVKTELIKKQKQIMLNALERIYWALWDIDIPSPTVPEYVEHHEQITDVMSLVMQIKQEIEDESRN